jgi:uncharacterized membrane protein
LDRAAFVLALAFVIVFSILLFRKHAAFNTRTYDFARFDQAIWNTLHGRFLFSSILNHSILGNHFSPMMALLAPLFLVWNDPRMLFLAQTLGIAVTGLLLFKIVRVKHPRLAPWFLLAFYLNPDLHTVTLFEFRRVVLAMPFLAMALDALYLHKRWCMALALGLALFCKENVAFVVSMVGFYLLVFERDWRWGAALMATGAAWLLVVCFWVIPAFAPPAEGPTLYPQLYYYDLPGDSLGEILANLARDPLRLVRPMLEPDRLRALWRVFLPMGIVLPFLAPQWVLICVPSIAYMLMSCEPTMYRLQKWYMAVVLPVLFAAIGVGLGRLSGRWAGWLTVSLLATAVAGYAVFSPAPLGGTYDPSLYRVTDHHRLASELVAAVPAEASVAALARYVPHLAHREHIYHYPWIVIGKENTDYIVLDRQSNPYPFSADELNREIDDLLADTSYVIDAEGDGIFLFRSGGDPLPSFPVDRVIDDSMRLVRFEIAIRDERGVYRTAEQQPVFLSPGDQVRVSLYWEALAAPQAERTVSVRIADCSGSLVALYDSLPAQGTKPTSWWEEGWEIRDVYHLGVSLQAPPGSGSLDLLVYDSYTQQVLCADDGREIVRLCELRLAGGVEVAR